MPRYTAREYAAALGLLMLGVGLVLLLAGLYTGRWTEAAVATVCAVGGVAVLMITGGA